MDKVARGVVEKAGYGKYFFHRTGHNIGTSVHGNGVNMDGLETHDVRHLIPHTCNSVEPGIYLPEFGMRTEVDVYVDDREARVTGADADGNSAIARIASESHTGRMNPENNEPPQAETLPSPNRPSHKKFPSAHRRRAGRGRWPLPAGCFPGLGHALQRMWGRAGAIFLAVGALIDYWCADAWQSVYVQWK